MDKGAHFYRSDFQVHTPRDLRWTGPTATTDDERSAYARDLVAACRVRGLQAIAVTDHHCMAFVPYIQLAALEETAEDGGPLASDDRLVVFPGMELTLGVPCQAILILDADFPAEFFGQILTALTIDQAPPEEAKTHMVSQLTHIQSMKQLKDELDKHSWLRGRYTVLPNVSGEGQHSLLRAGQHAKYAEMPWVGGYTDGELSKLKAGTLNILAGRDKAWGHKRIAVIQTSDTRRSDHQTLGLPSTWIKWATPTAEALRQACLAQESRISLDAPRVPDTYVATVSVTNSAFLGPIDLELNRQYSALIGGRGTGKSTVLEYIRWALCDQPPLGDEDETPNYQGRRRRLIDATLKAHGASVEVTYVLNGVPHVVRRSALDGAVQLKIDSGAFAPCTEDEVRALLPIQAYSQKQLSDVSVRVEELTRFITAPIKAELDRLARLAADKATHVRELYATRQRYRDLSRQVASRDVERRSLAVQAETVRSSLAGLSDADRAILADEQPYKSAGRVIETWRAGAGTLSERASELRRIAAAQKSGLEPAPEAPAAHRDALAAARADYVRMLDDAVTALDTLAQAASTIRTGEGADPAWKAWDNAQAGFQARYAEALSRSSSHGEKVAQLAALEGRLSDLDADAMRMRETVATLYSAEERYAEAREEWLQAQAERDELIDRECAALTERSGGLIRVHVSRYANAVDFVSSLRQMLSGSRVQGGKIEALGSAITEAEDKERTWSGALAELERLADFRSDQVQGEARPAAPLLTQFGLTHNDLDRIADTLQPEAWLNLSLTPIASVPVYEFRARQDEYIPFRNASAGQQATALLKTLLNQAGPPLLIDQPEEDLDNPVMLEVVKQLWTAKQIRQVVFASHNANLVVNGDAELVAWFDHRTTGDQSRGTIQGVGAIDVEDARAAIKRIMEGGEAAFTLRREKYGF
nr:hypothetical protein [uncultured Brevundimonas sp.]